MKFIDVLSSLAILAGSAIAASRTSPPSGAIVVGKSGGKYTNLQAAIDSISADSTASTTIFIQSGTYSGQVSIPVLKGKLVIYGYTTNDQDYTKNEVILTNTLAASSAGNNDKSATLRVATNHFSLYNVNVINGYGKGTQEGSQALAISANGEFQAFYACSFVGYQDTVYTNKPNQVFKNCHIVGATDIIFGHNGNSWFQQCIIDIVGPGFVTASGRSSADANWYVINKAKIAAQPGAGDLKASTTLGRPWRDFARVVVQNSDLGDVIKPDGWSAWNSKPPSNAYFAEYGNTGPGASGKRVAFAKQLSSAVSIDNIIPGWTSWVDMTYWNSS
ncbi:pectinesterase [Colletotrichum orchidophilum]|uniref:Pectinesterase n=1 Tax=Colletotrichum orchidophilum TaxID=1209926 RepID=A0A1G4AUC1_9PEZI|nr:pectinesterase [Colletotrichum orchidophilum]OHE92744.1 pectinesterase [Colletotrichum orchidophilum]